MLLSPPGLETQSLDCKSVASFSFTCSDMSVYLILTGDKCGLCDYGFYNLNINNTLGCVACDCDPRGSTSLFCDPDSGVCQCKTNVQGDR